jgi:nitroreductase
MSEMINIIKRRKSVRSFKPEQISDAELEDILEAALRAPLANNSEQWHFSVIQDRKLIDYLVKAIADVIKTSGHEGSFIKFVSSDAYHTFYHAPTVIVISIDMSEGITQRDYSAAAAAENILIAAESLNIGSCWIGGIVYPFDSEIGRKTRAVMNIPEAHGPDAVKIETSLKESMGIPEGYSPVAAIALGYKADGTTSLPFSIISGAPRNKDVITYARGV